jgi:hypothetical protein
MFIGKQNNHNTLVLATVNTRGAIPVSPKPEPDWAAVDFELFFLSNRLDVESAAVHAKPYLYSNYYLLRRTGFVHNAH